MKTEMHKFTVILLPDEGGYTVLVPFYPEVTTWGETPEEAFEMAQECLELILEVHAETHQDQVLPGLHASHVIVGAIEAEVPEVLLNDVREYEAEQLRKKPEEDRLKELRRKQREAEAMARFAKDEPQSPSPEPVAANSD